MDSTPEDDVLVISKLLSKLQSNLADESEATDAIETQAKAISLRLNIDYDEFVSQLDDLQPHSPQRESISPLERLRNENLALVLSLQRQEYLSASYQKLLREHQDLMSSINNSILTRKHFVEAKKNNEDMHFNEKKAKLKDEIELLRSQNEHETDLYDRTINDIRSKLKLVKKPLDDSKDEETESILLKLELIEKLILKEF